LQAELDFQYSGEANAATAVSIGKKIGAQTIITGILEEFGGLYRLQIRSIEVETASIQAMQNYLIGDDKVFDRLVGKEYKKLYLSAMPGFSFQLFNTKGTDYAGKKGGGSVSLDGALGAEFFINEMFSIQSGLFFTSDTMTISGKKSIYDAVGNFKYSYNTAESFSTQSLLIPMFAGVNLSPSIFMLGIFSLDAYGGFYVDIPLKSAYKDSFAGTEDAFKRSVLFGFAIGGSAGIKLGPGIVFFDMRYMGDFTNAKATISNKPVVLYNRHTIAFCIGYKIGFMDTKR
jgi:hypothetical protein